MLDIVDGWFRYSLFWLNLSEQKKYRQTSIQPRFEWYLTCHYYKNQIFILQTQMIPYFISKLKILIPKIPIEDPKHMLLVYWSTLMSGHLRKFYSFLSESKELINPKVLVYYIYFIISILHQLLSYFECIVFGAVQESSLVKILTCNFQYNIIEFSHKSELKWGGCHCTFEFFGLELSNL